MYEVMTSPMASCRRRTMWRPGAAVILLTAFTAFTAPLAAQRPDSPRSDIVAEIARLDSIWLTAYVTADVEAVRPIIADDFVGQVVETLMDKRDLLERVGASTGLEASILERLVVNVFGGVAVAHGVRRSITRDSAGSPVETRFAYTDVYVYRAGRWQCITGQSAALSDPGSA